MNSFKDMAGLLTSIGTVLAAFVAIIRYFQYKTKRDKIQQVRDSFDAVVKSLSSEDEAERLAGAILLRRFFDRKTEVGVAGVPYSREAVNVMAAILRGQRTAGNFQKLLADGLAFAPSLQRVDLQKTNLQYAYLGARKKGDGGAEIVTDLTDADFYRADLSGASLKKAIARGAKFYQARMHNCVLSEAHLEGASFFDADLKGAKFTGAYLSGAKFQYARNIPPALAQKLDENGLYQDTKQFSSPDSDVGTSSIRVFISKPGYLTYQQEQYIKSLLTRLETEGMTPQTLERADYPNFGTFSEVQRLMADCAGAVIFGFKELEVQKGVWRSGSPEEHQVEQMSLSTPWNQIEAGMAVMLGIPMLVLCQRGISGGVFDTAAGEHQVHRAALEEWNTSEFISTFSNWSADVRDRSRTF